MIDPAARTGRDTGGAEAEVVRPSAAPRAPARPQGQPRRGRWRLPVWAVLAFGFGGLVAAAAGTVLFLALGVAERNTDDLLRLSAENEIDRVVDAIAHHLGPARDQVEFTAAQIEGGAISLAADDRLEHLLLGALAATPQVSGIAVVRGDLSAVRAGREGGEYAAGTANWIDRPEIRLGIRQGPELDDFTWGAPLFIETLQTSFLAPRRPIRIGGEFRGLVTSLVSITELSDFLTGSAGGLRGTTFVLLGRDRVLAHPSLARRDPQLGVDQPLPELADVDDPVLAAAWSAPADDLSRILADSSVDGRLVRIGETDHVLLYREIADYGEPAWIVGMHIPADAVNEPVQRLVLAASVGFGIVVLAVVVELLLGRAIARPVSRLADAADAIRTLDPSRLHELPRSPFRELDSAALAFNSMLTGLRWFATYVPRSLVALLMRRGSSELLSEERQLTVLFTDIIGFSAIAQRLAPPQLAEFLNRHFALLAGCIEAEGGTVDKYIGDSIMAFWGAPEPQPDHAERACRAARRIAAALAADNERRARKGLRPVRLRIGLHSGPAIAGNIGAPGRINYTLIGDTVNTAQRLEQLGKNVDDGKADAVVLVSGATAAQVSCTDLTPLGSHVLRGREEQTEVYRLG